MASIKRSMKETICDQCKKVFKKDKFDFKRTDHNFCSRSCFNKFRTMHIPLNCGYCNKVIFNKKPAEIKKSNSGKVFCNNRCSASYFNMIRTKTRRSKIEKKLFHLLTQKYNTLNFIPNDKTMLEGLEVDIAVPDLKLAIEWNGIVHFKPIYGEKKLHRIQEIDQNKLKIAGNKNINLIVIADLISNDSILQKAFIDICHIIESLT